MQAQCWWQRCSSPSLRWRVSGEGASWGGAPQWGSIRDGPLPPHDVLSAIMGLSIALGPPVQLLLLPSSPETPPVPPLPHSRPPPPGLPQRWDRGWAAVLLLRGGRGRLGWGAALLSVPRSAIGRRGDPAGVGEMGGGERWGGPGGPSCPTAVLFHRGSCCAMGAPCSTGLGCAGIARGRGCGPMGLSSITRRCPSGGCVCVLY